MRNFLFSSRTEDSINIFFETGSPVVLNKDNSGFEKICAKIATGDTRDLESYISTASRIKLYTKGKFTVFSDGIREGIVLDGSFLPQGLSNLLLRLMDHNCDTKSLEMFWDKIKQNTVKSSRESLFDFIEANNITITENGNFIGYKSIRANWTDHHTGRFNNSPGKTVSIDRFSVNADRNITCSSGLHVAAYEYASSFYGGGKIVEVLVDPRDVVCVPYDYKNQKIRCCKYKVIREIQCENKKPVYDDYAGDPLECGCCDCLDDYCECECYCCD